MKAIQYQAYGSYEENRLVEVDRPKPKDSEVLVKMSTVGINPLDNTFRSGHIYLATPANVPRVGGQTGAGVVVESRHPAHQAGDRVFVGAMGWVLVTDGTWREYVAAPAAAISPIPANIDDDVDQLPPGDLSLATNPNKCDCETNPQECDEDETELQEGTRVLGALRIYLRDPKRSSPVKYERK